MATHSKDVEAILCQALLSYHDHRCNGVQPGICNCHVAKVYKAFLSAHHKALRAARKNEVSRFAQMYRRINPPIKDSPMELTEEAKIYNKLADDIALYETQRLDQLDTDKQEGKQC